MEGGEDSERGKRRGGGRGGGRKIKRKERGGGDLGKSESPHGVSFCMPFKN